MARTKRKALWGALETGGYGTDPSAGGGGYLPFPADVIPELTDSKEVLDTTYMTGRNWDTAPEEGRDGWELSGVELPLHGLVTAAADGVDASTVTDDWLDLVLRHIHGVQATTEGEGLTAVADATNLTADANTYALHDLLVFFESGVPAIERAQWGVVTAAPGAGVYTHAPGFADFGAAPVTTAGISYGTKRYTWDDDGGDTMAFVFRDDGQDYTLLGGRCTSAQIRIPPGGGRVKLVISWRGDRKIAESKASLPAAVVAPAITPIRSVRSPVWFNGVNYASAEATIDLGISTQEIASTAGAEGRAGDEHTMQRPIVTLRPQYTDAINDLKRNVTQGRLLVQIGAGRLSGGVLNAMAAHADLAVARVVNRVDDNNVARQEVQFGVHDPGAVGGAATNIWQLVRA